MLNTISPDAIIVNREERQRRELDEAHVASLARSIAKRGLINAIVIDDDDVLVAGECRLAAVKSLGWTSVEYRRLSDLSRSEAYAIELEENIKRRDLPWKDECLAVVEFHRLLSSENGTSWTHSQTAEMLGVDANYVTQRLAIQKEIESGNELVAEADKFSVARNITTRVAERRAQSEGDDIERLIAGESLLPAMANPLEELKATPDEASDEIPLLNLDFAEWWRGYSGPRFNFLHCDFPYGVKADKHDQGAAKLFRGYADDPDVYWGLIAQLGEAMDTIVADSAHLMFWYSLDYHCETRAALEQLGWKVNPFPLIWYKNDNTGILPDPARGPRRIYETAFLASRGDRKIVQPVGNCFGAPVVKTVHMSEKNKDMLSHFFRMFVDDTTVMLDPTCGSGNAVKVAAERGAKSVLGIERDPEFYLAARENW